MQAKRKIEVETVTLPEHWASALINGDYSGCEREDEKAINAWLRDNPHLSVVSCDEYADLVLFEGYLTNCLRYECHVRYTRETDTGLIYLIYPHSLTYAPLEWQKQGLSFTASGYGKKIPTSDVIFLRGRKHRVYVTQYSNAGTAWITFEGKRTIIR